MAYQNQFFNQLPAGTVLTVGNVLISGQYSLVLQGDGNLVLYKPLWSTQTDGKEVKIAYMQRDGNFVLYNNQGTDPSQAQWASNTYGNSGAYLQLTENAKLSVVNANGQVIQVLFPGV